MPSWRLLLFFFFFNDTATTEIYTLSLHDALPILWAAAARRPRPRRDGGRSAPARSESTRLNSSHVEISYAVFCLKKKKISTNRNLNAPKNTKHTRNMSKKKRK